MESSRPLKTVYPAPPPHAVKTLCFDDAAQSLRPNLVLVDRNGEVVFEINELGLKGAARDPSRKLGVVWGDSVVFGIGWGWPCLIDDLAAGWQFLNGGIEGDPYDNILRRAVSFNAGHAVALNVVMLGWHPWRLSSLSERSSPWRRWLGMSGGDVTIDSKEIHRRLRDDLAAFLGEMPGTVLATMPTALNPQIASRDLSPYFRRGDRDTVFTFAGDLPYSVALQRQGFDHIVERNEIVREAASRSKARLVDLAKVFDTSPLADFRQDFHDVLHLRPSAYAKAAGAVHAAIEDLL